MKSGSTHPFATALETMLSSYGGQWPPRGSFEDWPKCFSIYQETADEMPTKLVEWNDVQKFRAWLRQKLDKVDLIEVMQHVEDHLAHDDAILLGFAVSLAYLANAYRWGSLPTTEVERNRTQLEFPEKLWTPFQKITDFYGLAPRTNAFFLVTGNCTYEDGFPVDIRFCFNVDPSIIQSEKNFYLSSLYMEEKYRPALNLMADYLTLTENARESRDKAKQLLGQRVELLKGLKKVVALITRVYNSYYMKDDRISSDVWADYMQSMTGWNVNGQKGGASGAEFMNFNSLDAFLGTLGKGVIYQGSIRKRLGVPQLYRNCLEALEDESRSYRFDSFLDLPKDSDPLQKAKNDVIAMLHTWRVHHADSAPRYLEKSRMTSGGTIDGAKDQGETLAMIGHRALTERANETAEHISKARKPNTMSSQINSYISLGKSLPHSIYPLAKKTVAVCFVLFVGSLAVAVKLI